MKAAFFDLDGTLTEHRVWSGLLDYFKVNRIRLFRHYLFTFLHYGLYLLYKLGLVSQVNFRSIWAKNLSWHFAGFSLEKTAEIWDWVIEHRMKGQWRTDILAMLQQHKSDGDVIFLVSGGPEGLLEKITAEVGGHYAVGTRHEIVNGVYTGRSDGLACQGENKPILVKEKVNQLGLEINFQESFAYADSLSDLQLLSLVGKPHAVYPDDGLRAIALEKAWKIIEA